MGAPRNLTDGVLTVKDGSGTPKTLTVALDAGELKWSRKRALNPVYNRGSIASVRKGRDQMFDVSFKVAFDFLAGDTAGTTPSLSEALHGDGLAASSGWVGKDVSNGSAYCIDLSFEITAPGDSSKSETVVLGKFFVESLDVSDGEGANMVDVKGRCLTVTATRHS